MSNEQIQTTKGSDIKLPGLEQTAKLTGPEAITAVANSDSKLQPPQYPIADNKAQWTFACETHKYIREFLNNADNKAQRYIAFAAAFLIWTSRSDSYALFWSVPAKEWRLLDLINLTSIIGLSLCILLSLLALLPSLKGSKKGIIFFDSIAEHETSADYLADVLKKSEQDIVIEELKHVYELARICSKKFQKLKIAVWCGGIGLTLGILFVLLH